MLKSNIVSDTGKKNALLMGMTFIIIVGLFIVIQAVNGMYPFGSKSNLLWDQDIQYVDYFAFYRDVLLGKANIGYSFSKSMGGSLMALFGYYLGCPLNVFVVFFSKAQIPLFMFILNAVKLGLAGCTAQYFFIKRFPVLSDKMRVLLSIAYGLMQYVMIQSSNIMWLDGVILLPLLLVTVYRFITERKKVGLFVVVLCSIAINWYTGYMTLLFAIAYFIYERLLTVEQNKGAWKRAFLDLIRFGFTMGCGVLASCFLFYPIFKGLQNGKQAFDTTIFTPYVNGTLLDILRGYAVGSVVSVVSLYCGVMILGFLIYFFVSKRVTIKEKVLSGLAVGFMLVSCWFVPLECIWSGFRYAGSYRYRYSFVAVFLLIYLAAKGMQEYEHKKENSKLSSIFLVFVPIFLFFTYQNKFGQNGLLITAIIFAIYGVLFLLAKYQRLVGILIPLVFVVELVISGALTFQKQYLLNGDISHYQTYVYNSEKQVKVVKDQEDDVFFRMDTLQKRYAEENRCSAFLNESMVYGYAGLNHYSSTYDTVQAQMLYAMGYSSEVDLSIYSESILPADSLLGIKYLLSEDTVEGYKKLDKIPETNNKSVYYNPYAIDLGMMAADTVYEQVDTMDPFVYQNQLFSNILGREVALYKKAEVNPIISEGTLNFQFAPANEGNILYGYVDTQVQDLQLFVDGEYRCDYATWLGYKTFSLGTDVEEHVVTLNQYTGTKEEMTPYFYYLDQADFEKTIQELQDKEMTTTVFEDGHVEGTYAASTAGNMLLTIPYDVGWRAYVNGEKVEIRQAAQALMTVPVVQGENEIVLKYEIPGLKAGILISVMGILLFAGFCVVVSTPFE